MTDIAIVGCVGRYPQSPNIDALWANLVAGRDCVTEIPPDRWDWRTFNDPSDTERYSYGRWGAFLDGVDDFDPGFFGILPRDAIAIDPHERLFLECAWDLLETTGHLSTSTAIGDTGVFVGLMNSMYGQTGAARWTHGSFLGPRSAHWSVANRVSYFFDLHGPSLAVDSACSSSLLGVHLAAESLRHGECEAAIAGGVNLILHPAHYAMLSAAGMLARDGRCKTFDQRADGFVPGEGVGAVLLKRLPEALAAGDEIWGVIKGSQVRSEGRTMGYAVPSPSAQARLIADSLRRSSVAPATVTYLEAHGTGTALGDPIEVDGINRAYGEPEDSDGSRFIGSIKSNIGHLEGAAGIAGLTKVLLQLRHGQLVPTVNLVERNPKIDFDRSPFIPVTELTDWPSGLGPRRAAVSSFGAGGTDVHMVVEEYRAPNKAPQTPGRAAEAFLLSARNAEQLTRLAQETLKSLTDGPLRYEALPRLAYTSQVGRREMRERLGVVAASTADLRRGLSDFLDGIRTAALHTGRTAAVAPAAPGPDTEIDDLVAAWCAGAAVRWDAAWAEPRPRRCSLPTYPFARRAFRPRLDDGRT